MTQTLNKAGLYWVSPAVSHHPVKPNLLTLTQLKFKKQQQQKTIWFKVLSYWRTQWSCNLPPLPKNRVVTLTECVWVSRLLLGALAGFIGWVQRLFSSSSFLSGLGGSRAKGEDRIRNNILMLLYSWEETDFLIVQQCPIMNDVLSLLRHKQKLKKFYTLKESFCTWLIYIRYGFCYPSLAHLRGRLG